MTMKSNIRTSFALLLSLPFALLVACGDDSDNDGNTPDAGADTGIDTGADADSGSDVPEVPGLDVPETYTFDSRFSPGTSSLAYDGQVMRQALIVALNSYIGGINQRVVDGTFTPAAAGDVTGALNFFFRFDSEVAGSELIPLSHALGFLQTTWDSLSAGKDLVGKLAGNDASTDHRDWSSEFAGWSDASIATDGGGIGSPTLLVEAFFATLEQNAIGLAEGEERLGPDGTVLPVHVTETGLDLQQLVNKVIQMGVSFSQGLDDYLDDDVSNKGILSPNTRDGEKPWTVLEHQWDEGFGYFGAARDYLAYTDGEIAGRADGRAGYSGGAFDTDGDGTIDLNSEMNFGASTNAAKRDLDSAASAPTDFTRDAMLGFLTGRAIIAAAGEALTDNELAALRAERDRVAIAWEGAIAATVLHYVNDSIRDHDAMGTEAYNFLDHAKHWSEMKGFAIGLQFNPHSPLSREQFLEFHRLVGDAPVLQTASQEAQDAYRANLLAARAILAEAYGFDAANVGDDNGANGW